jgi:hypothetical protein
MHAISKANTALRMTCLCAAFSLLPALAQARDLAGWFVKGSGTEIIDGQSYSLFNTDQKLHLKWKDRPGFNAGWDTAPNNTIKFKRKSGSGPIQCGEPIAISFGGTYMFWGEQPIGTGIKLTSDKKIKDSYYQWIFKCQDGTPVPLNKPVILHNTVEKDSVVGARRTWGVNLAWADDVYTIFGENWRIEDVPKKLRKKMKQAGATAACAAMGAGPEATACGEMAAGG